MLDVVAKPLVSPESPLYFWRKDFQHVRVAVQIVKPLVCLEFVVLDAGDVVEVRDERPQPLPVVRAASDDAVIKTDHAVPDVEDAVVVEDRVVGRPARRRDLVVKVEDGFMVPRRAHFLGRMNSR